MITYFNIRKFHSLPEFIQWIQASILGLSGFYLSFSVISSANTELFLFSAFLLKPFIHFCMAPLLKLTGFFRYYSPMLLTVKTGNCKMEIHNGNMFDYFSKMKWKQKGREAREKIMTYYLTGLLQITEDIELGKLSVKTSLTGVSYFFSEKTVKKMGFSFARVNLFHKILFIFDYINLFVMYSFSKGKFAFPSVFKLKKVKISAKKLLDSKARIIELLVLLKKRNLLKEIKQDAETL